MVKKFPENPCFTMDGIGFVCPLGRTVFNTGMPFVKDKPLNTLGDLDEPQLHIIIHFILKNLYMKTTEWGPSIWIFLHALIAKMNPNHYLQVKDELLYQVKQICSILPCPDCTMHATKYLQTIKSIPTKELFAQMLFVFHNSVNYRTQKQQFQYSDMAKYNNLNMKILYNNFLFVMTQRISNPKMMLDVLNRNKIINEFDVWMKKNLLTI